MQIKLLIFDLILCNLLAIQKNKLVNQSIWHGNKNSKTNNKLRCFFNT